MKLIDALSEAMGKAVRDEWVRCKLEEIEQGRSVPDHHLTEWDDLDERNKEIDRRIGLAVLKTYCEHVIHMCNSRRKS